MNFNVYSIISSIAVYIYLSFIVYSFKLKKKSTFIYIFIFLNLTALIWSFSYIFIFSISNVNDAWFWYKISSIGFCNFSAFLLHFSLLLTKREKLLKRKSIYPLIYFPGIYFSLKVISDPRLMDHFSLFFKVVVISSIEEYIFSFFYMINILLSIYLIWNWGIKTKIQRERKQAIIIIAATLIAGNLGLLTTTILPFFNIKIVPALASTFGVIWMLGIWIAIDKYKLLNLTVAIAAEDIISKIVDLLLLLDNKGVIINSNKQIQNILGYNRKELNGIFISEIIAEKEFFTPTFQDFLSGKDKIEKMELNYITKKNAIIPVEITGSIIKDQAGDSIGISIIAHDMRKTKELENRIIEHFMLNKRLEEAQFIASRDMRMAINVQNKILVDSPPITPEWDTAFYFKPMTDVSGDFYDFYLTDEELTGASIFDVSGHGIASGLITMTAKPIIFRHFNSDKNMSLGEIMTRINKELISEIGNIENYITGIILRFNENEVEYVNAGHPDIIHKSNKTGKVEYPMKKNTEIRGSILGIDVMEDNYESIKFNVEKDDFLILYSDCLTEMSGKNSKKTYNIQGKIESLTENNDISAEEILTGIIDDFINFTGKTKFSDDLTVLVLRRKI